MLGAAYSIEPYRLKKRPVLDVLANALANGVLNTLAGWAAGRSAPRGADRPRPLPPRRGGGPPLDDPGRHRRRPRERTEDKRRRAGTAERDHDLDGPHGRLVRGRGPDAEHAGALCVGRVAALFHHSLRYRREKDRPGARILLPAKVSTLAYSLAACALFPVYIPVLAATIMLTRCILRERFGIRYPAL